MNLKSLSPSLVAVKRIASSVPRSNFAENELDNTAKQILEIGGLINPIVVCRTSSDAYSYEVVDGHFEYYAAARAKEIDPIRGETIGAFIIEPENEKALLAQVQVLRKQRISTNTGVSEVNQETKISPGFEQRLTNLESRQTNIESRSENRLNELRSEYLSEIKALKSRMEEIETRIKPVQTPLLDSLNNMELPKLISELSKISGVNSTVIANFKKERSKQPFEPFTSFEDVVKRVDKLGGTTMIKIIDGWQKQ